MPRTPRRLSLHTALTVQPQRLTQNQREYVVAPCIMIVEGVLNSGLVPGDAIRACHWDGIPVVINHPMADDGTPLSANAPDVPSVGRVYRTQYLTLSHQGRTLTRAQAELWLDVAQVQALGADAVQAMQMIETQNPLEVSTAFYATAEQTHGQFYGVPYTAIHHDLIADHLALLPGGIGACSWADGCGCPRLNAKETSVELKGMRAVFSKLQAFVHVADAHLVTYQTDTDTREALYGALAREMGLDMTPIFIDSLDMAAQTFTYRQGERLVQRSWTVEDGQIVLTADARDVQRDTRYIPVTQQQEEAPMPPSAAVKARVTALITNTQTAWEEADRAQLEGLSDEQLQRLEPTPPAAAPATFDEAMATLPAHLRESVGQMAREHATRKQAAITALVAANYPLSEARLTALTLGELEQLATLTVEPGLSYAGQGLPAVRTHDGEESWLPKSILAKKE